jgi:hypothetical protein
MLLAEQWLGLIEEWTALWRGEGSGCERSGDVGDGEHGDDDDD